MSTVFVVTFDQGLETASNGFDCVFSTEQKAKEYIEKQRQNSYNFYIEEVEINSK